MKFFSAKLCAIKGIIDGLNDTVEVTPEEELDQQTVDDLNVDALIEIYNITSDIGDIEYGKK